MSNMSNNPTGEEQSNGSNQFEVPASSQIVPAPAAYLVAQGSPAMYPVAQGATRGMYTAAAVINWVVLGIIVAATLGFGIIVAAWFIPMTILIHKGAKGPYKHTGLAVCTLLFCNIISGILMLVDDGNRPSKPVA